MSDIIEETSKENEIQNEKQEMLQENSCESEVSIESSEPVTSDELSQSSEEVSKPTETESKLTEDSLQSSEEVSLPTDNESKLAEDSTETSENPHIVSACENQKKKRNPVAAFIGGFFKAILYVILILIIALVIWLCFSAFNKKSVLSVIPSDFALYAKADSVWDTVEPMLDLQAADILLSDASLSQVRGAFMEFRSSSIRKNPIIAFLGKRELNAAVYVGSQNQYDFIGVLELGVLSGATRLAPVVQRFIHVDNLLYEAKGSYFVFKASDDLNVYFKADHDLAIVSTNLDLFLKAISGDNTHSASVRTVISKKDDEKVKIYLDTKKLISLYSTEGDTTLIDNLSEILDYNSLSKVALDIDDHEVKVKITVPYKTGFSIEDKYPILRASTVPGLIAKFPESVQYYTMLNAGSIEELRNTAFPFLPASLNIESLWNTGSSLSKTLLGASLEDILFSWTGNEICAFGIEGQNDPIFAIQVKDEKQRREVFDKILSSLLMKDDNSLILDGVRVPRIMLPAYIQNILDVFGINLQMPYYIVDNGYVLFSTSAECLSNFHRSSKYMDTLSKSENYVRVAKGMDSNVFMSLYYNLDRAVPFFIRKNAQISKILELYSLGRFDMSIRNGNLIISLQANSEKVVKLRDVPGFPMELSGRNDGILISEAKDNPGAIFWVQDGVNVMSMEMPSTKISSMQMNEKVAICAMEKAGKSGGTLWAVTESGCVYLLDRKLGISDGFPVISGYPLVDKPVSYNDSVVFSSSDGTLCMVTKDGKVKSVKVPVTNSIFASPSVLKEEKAFAVYDKGFIGRIHVVNEKDFTLDAETEAISNVMNVAGIGFGNAAMLKYKGNVYTAFITQAGIFNLWCNGESVQGFPYKLDGVFNVNCVALGDCFYVLSEEAVLTRVNINGGFLEVQVPYGKGKTPFLSVVEGNIYVCADSNTIYGFTPELELLYNFPVTGWGIPVYADVNGDNEKDCFALGLDGRMYCWNVK